MYKNKMLNFSFTIDIKYNRMETTLYAVLFFMVSMVMVVVTVNKEKESGEKKIL